MSSLKKPFTEAVKSYSTFGASDYSQGKAPYQSAGEALLPPVPEIPALPTPAPANVMPLPDDEAAKAARRQATESQRRRSGRRSTILSESGDLATLGGG